MDKITFENLPSTNTPINADNLNAMQNNVDNAKLDKTIVVTEEGTDLNDYKDDGIYFFVNNASLPSNRPANIYGWVEVIGSNGFNVRQFWHRSSTINGSSEYQTFVRLYNRNADTWSAWERLATEHDCYYMAGDSFSYYAKIAVRANANDIRFQIPLDKPVKSGVTPTVTISTATLFQSASINMTNYIDTINSATVAGSVIEVNAQLTSSKPSGYSANVATIGDIRVNVTFN